MSIDSFAALPRFSNIYYFGDSLTDVGNFVVSPEDPCNKVNAPVTNKIGGFTPGKMWANFSEYGFNAKPSRNGGNNFAVSEALSKQVLLQIEEFIHKNSGKIDPDALYVVWVGANDFLDLANQVPNSQLSTLKSKVYAMLDLGVNNIIAAINKIYSVNASAHPKNFLIIGVPDISLAPLVANPAINPELHALRLPFQMVLSDWNKTLKLRLQTTAKSLGINIYYYDPFTLMQKIIQNPRLFGFRNNIQGVPNNQTMWCMPKGINQENPDNYIFYNLLHPTSHLQKWLAEDIVKNADKL